ncbi:MAG: RNA methyltransferase [Gemmatimonadota bacterium]|nr:RNA methyltransferase [Gemmatimonadota bacterium]
MHRNQVNNPAQLLTLARDLQRRKARERNGLFVAEGVRAVEELARAGVPVRGVLVTPGLPGDGRGAAVVTVLAARGVPIATLSDAEFESAAGTDNPQGILAIAEVPMTPLAGVDKAQLMRTLVLDGVQDPGNVGTLIRTAAALGVRTIVALPGTADLWNAKVVRGAVGGHFHLTVTTATLNELATALRGANVPLWGADTGGRAVDDLPAPHAFALAVGNEGAGLSPAVRAAAAQLVSLPMTAGVESLNVAVAAGVLLYALRS